MTQDAVGSYTPAGPYPQHRCLTRAKHFTRPQGLTRSSAALPVRSTLHARRALHAAPLLYPCEALSSPAGPMPLHSLKRQQANTASTTTIRTAKTDGG